MGIEALSRGAASLISIETNKDFAKQIQANLKHLGYASQSEVIITDVARALPILTEKSFDIIFADPPYKDALVKKLPELIGKYNLLDEDGVFILEHLKTLAPKIPEHSPLECSSTRNYGQTSISFFAHKGSLSDDSSESD